MQTLSEIRTLLAERGLRPKHRLGQNFLHDKNQIARLVDAASVSPGDLVLEVGPGTGTLTEELLERGADVVCCEIDRDLAGVIADRLGDRVTLVVGDVLERERHLNHDIILALNERPFKLIANLPYQVASPLMAALLIDRRHHCTGQFVTIQKEVADRLLAPSGRKEYGPLSVIVQALGDVRRIGTLSPSCFWPQPHVTSAMVAITPRMDRAIDDPESFARFVTQLFTKRRKQLGTIFGRPPHHTAALPAGITHDQRPDALRVDQIIALWLSAPSPRDS